nr:hypothetical protein [Streptomyces sp. NRRL F-5527]
MLYELEADGVGRGNQVNILRTLTSILRDAYDKGAMADDPVKGVQEPEYVREKAVMSSLAYVKRALGGAGDDLALPRACSARTAAPYAPAARSPPNRCRRTIRSRRCPSLSSVAHCR